MITPDNDMTTKLIALLDDAGIVYSLSEHDPVYTSVEAAEVRGSTLHSGAKALIIKGDKGFVLAVIPADLALNSPALRKVIKSRRLRFATREELLELTGLEPGSVPPFGRLFNLQTICDDRLSENEKINFNAASHSQSVQMSFEDYINLESPILADITKKD